MVLTGSGSYTPRLLGPSSAQGLELARYEMGKAIASGKIRGSRAASSAETNRLEELNSKLPLNARKHVDLSRVSGLSPEQMQALEYFLGVRYKVK
jgi:hypothetical protein